MQRPDGARGARQRWLLPRSSFKGLRLASGAVALGAAGLLTACPNPNTYGTPRTVEPGKVSHSIAAEWVGWRFEVRRIDQDGQPVAGEPLVTESGSVIVPPTYTLRLGVAEQVDVGFRAAQATSLAGDVKYNFYRSEVVDLAVDPGIQWMFVGFNVYHWHMPLLVGVNVSQQLSIVLTPGLMYGVNTYNSGNETFDRELDRLLSTDGWYGRLGLGLNVRVSRGFALHPEITFLRSLADDDGSPVRAAMSYLFGIGFNFGNLPDYGPVE